MSKIKVKNYFPNDGDILAGPTESTNTREVKP